MGKAALAMLAAAAVGTALLISDTASARPGGAGASRGGGSGGARSGSVAGPRSGLARRSGAVHGRGGTAVRRDHLNTRRAFGASVLDAGVPLYESAPGLPPNCQVRRVQIDDDYGWRVRDMVVCPHNDTTAR